MPLKDTLLLTDNRRYSTAVRFIKKRLLGNVDSTWQLFTETTPEFL